MGLDLDRISKNHMMHPHVEHQDTGTTLLSGPLPDQAALQGLLLQIVRLGLILLSAADERGSRGEEAAERS